MKIKIIFGLLPLVSQINLTNCLEKSELKVDATFYVKNGDLRTDFTFITKGLTPDKLTQLAVDATKAGPAIDTPICTPDVKSLTRRVRRAINSETMEPSFPDCSDPAPNISYAKSPIYQQYAKVLITPSASPFPTIFFHRYPAPVSKSDSDTDAKVFRESSHLYVALITCAALHYHKEDMPLESREALKNHYNSLTDLGYDSE